MEGCSTRRGAVSGLRGPGRVDEDDGRHGAHRNKELEKPPARAQVSQRTRMPALRMSPSACGPEIELANLEAVEHPLSLPPL